MPNAIEVHHLKKCFRLKGNQTVEAVRGISLSVAPGEIFGFLGPNGAGKTTCMRMLTTLLPIDEGQAHIAGYDVKKQSRKVRPHIGYVGQLGGADALATGRENLVLAGRLYGMRRGAAEERSEALAALLNLEELMGRTVNTYSGGQKRRLEVALGIVHRPEVLFLDEPTTGLDPQNRANLWSHIRKLRDSGMTVFVTTHYMEEADGLCDHLAIIDHGEIVAEGAPDVLKSLISEEEIARRVRREACMAATLDDVFLKITGRSLRDREAVQ